MTKRRIAIIGAGFAGLATCYHLLSLTKHFEVTLFDPKGIGGGTSGIAAGLVHPHPGKEGRLSWRGEEGLLATKELLEVASCALGVVISRSGLIRVPLKGFKEPMCKREALYPALLLRPALFLSSGLTIASKWYLEGIWRACCFLGARFKKCAVFQDHLASYDQVVIAAGAASDRFFPDMELPLKVNKGQLLVCKRPPLFPLKMSVIGNGYLALDPLSPHCYLGSTYEHSFSSKNPCLETAKALILNRAAEYLKFPSTLSILRCVAGLRTAHQKRSHPIVEQITSKMWLFTGLGSRGLLYHAYLGRLLAEAIAKETPALLPREVRI